MWVIARLTGWLQPFQRNGLERCYGKLLRGRRIADLPTGQSSASAAKRPAIGRIALRFVLSLIDRILVCLGSNLRHHSSERAS